MNEDKKGKMKVLFPDDIETITISKNDYDRLYGDLTYQNIELQQENTRLKDKVKKAFEIVDDKLTNLILQYGVNNEFREEYDELWEILKEN